MLRLLALFWVVICTGCATRVALELADAPMTFSGIGAGQGVSVIDGMVYFYGDRHADDYRGIIIEARWEPTKQAFIPTGRAIRLTVDSKYVAPHPTGLTHHERWGTFLGSTLAGRGTILKIDFDRAVENGTLDGAVLNTIDDNAAVNGTRPCFVRLGDRQLVATSDYGGVGNRVRLYDPSVLSEAKGTQEPGVEVASFSCGPWVQNLLWLDGKGWLVLVQNTTEGLGWRLSFQDLEASVEQGRAVVVRQVDLEPADELEGMAMLDPTTAVRVAAECSSNVRLARIRIAGEGQ
jgi:hypothetical protein